MHVAQEAVAVAGWALACCCAAYMLLAIASVLGHARTASAAPQTALRVTVLKPLCGMEPGLAEALDSFLAQETRFPVRFVFGVAQADDDALGCARWLAARHPDAQVEIIIDPTTHGANPKVSNLINMARAGLGDILVISDSDVIIPAGALQRLVDRFARADVGAVTTLYRGRPQSAGNLAQYFGALYLDGWFLPTALLHARLAQPQVCYGPMTAIRREVLEAAGGLPALADCLADDTELGKLTRAQGYRIAFAPDVAETWVNDASLPALFAHELRWARTIRALEPGGYVASLVMHPGPLPLLFGFVEHGPWALDAWLTLVLLRWLLVQVTWMRFGRSEAVRPADPLTLWLRDQLYFAVWVCGFFGRRVRWRGRDFMVGPEASMRSGEPAVLQADLA